MSVFVEKHYTHVNCPTQGRPLQALLKHKRCNHSREKLKQLPFELLRIVF